MTNQHQPHAAPEDTVTEVVEARPRQPAMYKVLLINDDYTPMDFVVHVLEQFFSMPHPRATKVMLEVHTQGKGLCGIYTHEIAETKVVQVNDYAREQEHPLLCMMEKA